MERELRCDNEQCGAVTRIQIQNPGEVHLEALHRPADLRSEAAAYIVYCPVCGRRTQRAVQEDTRRG